jgi:hypothetical protein
MTRGPHFAIMAPPQVGQLPFAPWLASHRMSFTRANCILRSSFETSTPRLAFHLERADAVEGLGKSFLSAPA